MLCAVVVSHFYASPSRIMVRSKQSCCLREIRTKSDRGLQQEPQNMQFECVVDNHDDSSLSPILELAFKIFLNN